MHQVGDLLRVKEPFTRDFPGTYVIEEVIQHDDGQIVYILEGIGGFAPIYVEGA